MAGLETLEYMHVGLLVLESVQILRRFLFEKKFHLGGLLLFRETHDLILQFLFIGQNLLECFHIKVRLVLMNDLHWKE